MAADKPTSAREQAIKLLQDYKNRFKKPTSIYKSQTARLPEYKPKTDVYYDPKGAMGDVKVSKGAGSWAKGTQEVRPLPKSTTQDCPFYDVKRSTTPTAKGPSASMRSTTDRLESPRRPDIPYAELKGMGAVTKKKATGSFASHSARLPEYKAKTDTNYEIRNGVGDVKKAKMGGAWARSTSSMRPEYKSSTPDFLNPKDPYANSAKGAKCSFRTTEERLPSKPSLVPGPGTYASPLISAGML